MFNVNSNAIEQYNILVNARDFEVDRLWKNSNQFFVFNTAVFFVFFLKIDAARWPIFIAIIGVLVSLLWVFSSLSSERRIVRIEGALAKFEKKNLQGFVLYSANKNRMDADYRYGLILQGKSRSTKKFIYEQLAKYEESGYSVIRLATIFFMVWFVAFIILAVEISDALVLSGL